MNVCFIGKHKYPKDVFSNEQDMKTWRSMAKYFDRLFIIVESPGFSFHGTGENNINIYLLPQLGYPGFILNSVLLGFYLNLRYSINIFDASEIGGGGVAATFLKFLTGRLSVIEVQGEIFRSLRLHNSDLRINPNSTNKICSIRMSFMDLYYYYKSWFLQKIGRWAMRRAARIRVISRAIFNQVRAQGIGEDKIRLVSLRADLDLFNPRHNTKIRLNTNDTNSTNKIVNIGYIGRLVDGKGLEDLLHAVANLKGQIFPTFRSGSSISRPNQRDSGEIGTNFKLLIFGTGLLKPELKRMAQELEISDLVSWRGLVPYGKVPEALAEIDIFVYPSWHEGFGRSIMEALAMEKPVVATNIGGIPDLVQNGENGFLVEPHNPGQLAEKIKILAENKTLREKFGQAGRAWIAENFEWREGIQKFAQLFLGLDNANN